MTTAEIVEKLQQASADLLWLSESEYPFEILQWGKDAENTPETVIASHQSAADTAIETIALADFFAPALEIADWYGEEELADVKRYQELYQTIEANLEQVQVFRLGEIEITVYILGKTPDGDVVGLRTLVVET
jgi:hypothetical protein